MDLGRTFEEHKKAILITVAALVVLYILLRGRSSSQSSPVSALLGYQAQQNQLGAQLSLQQQQIAAQQDAVDQQYAAQNAQVQAAANAQNYQTEAGLISNLYSTQQSAQLGQAQLGTEQHITDTQYATDLAALQTQYGSADYQAQLAAQLYGTQLQDTYNLNQSQYDYMNNSLAAASQYAETHGVNGSQNRLSIIQSLLNQPGAASATQQAQAYQAGASASMWSNVIGSLTKGATGAVGSFFG